MSKSFVKIKIAIKNLRLLNGESIKVRENIVQGNVQAISAGFFIGDPEKLWVGGESLTLELHPRPQDTELVRAFLTSPTPEFNFVAGGVQ